MAIPIEQLVVKISADLSELRSEMATAKKTVASSTSEIKKSVASTATSFMKWTVVVLAARRAYTEFTKTINETDALIKQARVLGTTTNDLQAFRLAGELAGVSAQQMGIGLRFMVKSIGDTARGTGEAKEAFKDLKINVQELLGLDTTKQFELIADRIRRYGSNTKQASFATKIFSESGQRFLNIIRDTSKPLDAARQKIKEFGLELTDLESAQIEALNDQLTLMGRRWEGVKTRLLAANGPLVMKAINAVIQTTNNLRLVWAGVQLVVTSYARTAVGTLATVEMAATKVINALIDQINVLLRKLDETRVRMEMTLGLPVTTHGLGQLSKLESGLTNVFKTMESNASDALQRIRNDIGNIVTDIAHQDQSLQTMLTDLEDKANPVTIEQERQEKILQAKKDASDAAIKIAMDEANAKAVIASESTSTILGSLSDILGAGENMSREQFEWSKALALGEAVMNTRAAVMKIMAQQGAYAGPQIAAAIATGAAQVAAIASTTFGGGGSASAGGVSTGSSAVLPTQQVDINISGNGQTGAVGVDRILREIADLQRDGVNTTFNVMGVSSPENA